MGRKNKRAAGSYEPLDLTQAIARRPAPPRGWESFREAREREVKWHQMMDRRQRDARANQGIDWNVCLVPGCGEAVALRLGLSEEDRDHRQRLPLCLMHLGVAHAQGARSNDPHIVSAIADLMERRAAKRAEAEVREKREYLARTDGSIYYIRLNGLIKVGWSRTVSARIANYGPQVEVLAVHPGTRSDETNLHRQLKPARAVGREWYEDGPILARFVEDAVKQYGPPPKFESPMRKPKQIVAGKRHAS